MQGAHQRSASHRAVDGVVGGFEVQYDDGARARGGFDAFSEEQHLNLSRLCLYPWQRPVGASLPPSSAAGRERRG